MSLLTVLLSIWGVLTGVLVLLLIYRSTLAMHEDDQLFLNDAESHLQIEQNELQRRMSRIQPILRVLGAGSGLLILVIGGLWLWQGIAQSHL
ncbi:MAG TPA: hypothetical protein VK699_00220 [Terriglobales bacterium]|jgi:hypothetical protein|nr:hypothetical protein [Terriglobales bacterium]